MRRFRAQDVSLGVVAVLVNIAIVAGLVWLLFGRGTDATTTTAPVPTSTATRSTTAPAPTSTSARPTQPSGIGSVLAGTGPVTIAVLGDETGDETGEWVSSLAELAGQTRTVTLRGLDPADPTQYTQSSTVGTAGPALTIYNASRPGSTAAYGAQRLRFLVPAPPTAVLLSYGRATAADGAAADLDTLLTALRKVYPTVPVGVVIQPPDRNDAAQPVREATLAWARGQSSVFVIDVAAAFAKEGDPQRFVSQLDPVSVNAAGGRLWAEAVFAALGGSLAPAAGTPAAAAPGTAAAPARVATSTVPVATRSSLPAVPAPPVAPANPAPVQPPPVLPSSPPAATPPPSTTAPPPEPPPATPTAEPSTPVDPSTQAGASAALPTGG